MTIANGIRAGALNVGIGGGMESDSKLRIARYPNCPVARIEGFAIERLQGLHHADGY